MPFNVWLHQTEARRGFAASLTQLNPAAPACWKVTHGLRNWKKEKI